jgi:hypothetical protein
LRKHSRALVIVYTVRRTIIATVVVVLFTFTDVGSTETDNVLGENDNDREIQASHGATAIAGDRILNVDDAESSIPETSYNECNTSPLEAAEQQRTDQTNSAFDLGCCDEFLNSRDESSGQTPALTTASALSFPSFADDKLATVRMSNIKAAEIIDERIGSSGL